MDLGDIIRLIFFGIIFLSFFGGFFGRKSDEEKKPAPRPTDIFESGGQQPVRTQPVLTQTAEPIAEEVSWEDAPRGRQTSRPEAYESPAYGDAFGSGNGSQAEQRRQPPAPRAGSEVKRRDVRTAERELLEQDLTDLPPAMDLNPEQRSRQGPTVVPVRRRRRQDAEILRGWLRDPDTLGRAFIVKEVLDKPVGMRDQR